MSPDNRKSDFIKNAEEIAGAALIFVIFSYLITAFTFLGFGPRLPIIPVLVLILGPYSLIITFSAFILAKFIGWLQEGKIDIAIFVLILLIGIILFLQLTGSMDEGIQFFKDFGESSIDERLHTMDCALGTNYCNGTCYTMCGEGLTFICDYNTGGRCEYNLLDCEKILKHNCKGTCWENCPAGRQFICDDQLGGVCKPY
jgi:hypothetical protein